MLLLLLVKWNRLSACHKLFTVMNFLQRVVNPPRAFICLCLKIHLYVDAHLPAHRYNTSQHRESHLPEGKFCPSKHLERDKGHLDSWGSARVSHGETIAVRKATCCCCPGRPLSLSHTKPYTQAAHRNSSRVHRSSLALHSRRPSPYQNEIIAFCKVVREKKKDTQLADFRRFKLLKSCRAPADRV